MAWKQQQGVVVARPSVARRLWRVVRAVLCMLRRSLPSGRKLTMDLHLFLHRGKIAGKALGDLRAVHHHGHHRAASSSSAASGCLHYYYNYDAADVARVFEMLNDGDRLFSDDEPTAATTAAHATPSPAQQLWAFARSPAVAALAASSSRKLRITDSPFQAAAMDADDAQVDRQADEFIRRFYEQLRAEKSAASTPDYYGYAPSPYAVARLAAGVA